MAETERVHSVSFHNNQNFVLPLFFFEYIVCKLVDSECTNLALYCASLRPLLEQNHEAGLDIETYFLAGLLTLVRTTDPAARTLSVFEDLQISSGPR